ncbi:MAG: acylphosphatase [Fimbriimonadaceae bacterium]|nr:acylphosphatase [Fimbriimonadaceae bacterium]QYK55316.1 MAG: acylphosphatase [Fimbriimonadaceae bacterium]
MTASRRLIVSGHVQGVGFRAFVVREALGLGLSGEVWNRADGAVELLAAGPEADLDKLGERLWSGPGRVDGVLAEPASPVLAQGFSVAPSR